MSKDSIVIETQIESNKSPTKKTPNRIIKQKGYLGDERVLVAHGFFSLEREERDLERRRRERH